MTNTYSKFLNNLLSNIAPYEVQLTLLDSDIKIFNFFNFFNHS